MAEENWGGLRLAGGSWMPINCMVPVSDRTHWVYTDAYSGSSWSYVESYIKYERKTKEYVQSFWSVNLNAFADPASPSRFDALYVGTDVFDVELFSGVHLVFHIQNDTRGYWCYKANGAYSSARQIGYDTIRADVSITSFAFPFINSIESADVAGVVGFKHYATSASENIYQLFERIEQEFTSLVNLSAEVDYISLLTLGGGTYSDNYSSLPSNDISSQYIILTPNTFVYDGSAAEPSITIATKDGLTVLEENVDYTVAYHNNTAPGTGYVVISGIGAYTGSVTKWFYIWSLSNRPPYDGLPPADVGGGTYTPPSESDSVNIPSLPQTDFSSVNFTRIYVPTASELRDLATYMWTNQNFIDYLYNRWKDIWGKPSEAIIALNVFPCAIPKGSSEEVRVMFNPTGVYMSPAIKQFIPVDCGTLEIPHVYNSALDYNPYTTVSLFLPFIGTVNLDADEVMGKTIHIKYHIDIVTGTCVALIEVGSVTMYQYSGVCCMTIPLSQANYTTIVGAIFGVAKIAGSIALGVASGGASLAGQAAAALGASSAAGLAAKLPVKSTYGVEGQGAQNFAASVGHAAQGLARSGVDNTVSSVMNGKNHIEHTGSFVGNAGFLGVRRPYAIIRRPNLVNPQDYGKYNGYPSLVSVNLSECSGYTEVQQIQLTGLSATNAECDEILRLLKGGVIF